MENNENNTCFIAFSNLFFKVCTQFTKRGQPSRQALTPIRINFSNCPHFTYRCSDQKNVAKCAPNIYKKKTAQNTYIRGSLWHFFFYIYWLVTLVILTWPGANFGPKTVPKKGVEATVLSIDGQNLIATRRDSRIKTSAGLRGG